MENKKAVGICAGIVLVLVALGRYCDRPKVAALQENATGKPTIAFKKDYVLKPEENSKVIVDTDERRVTVVSPNKIEQFTGVRHAAVVVKADGKVEVTAKQYGFCFEPGLGIVVSDRVGPLVDLQFAYWKRFGLLAGARPWPGPTGVFAVGYELSGIGLHNTSVFLGIDLRKNPAVGVRVRL